MRPGLALLLLLVPVAATATADEIVLRNGGRLTGEIVSQDEKRVVIDTGPGQIVVPRSQVARVTGGSSAIATYRARAARLDERDTAGWLALARWAKQNGLSTQAREAWNHVLSIDPQNTPAHLGLGDVQVAGQWLSEDEAFRARGFVQFEGRWVRPEDRSAVVAERAESAVLRQREVEAQARASEAAARAREAESRARAAAVEPTPPPAGIPVGVLGVGGYGPTIFVPPGRPARPPRHPREHDRERVDGEPSPPPPPPPVPPRNNTSSAPPNPVRSH